MPNEFKYRSGGPWNWSDLTDVAYNLQDGAEGDKLTIVQSSKLAYALTAIWNLEQSSSVNRWSAKLNPFTTGDIDEVGAFLYCSEDGTNWSVARSAIATADGDGFYTIADDWANPPISAKYWRGYFYFEVSGTVSSGDRLNASDFRIEGIDGLHSISQESTPTGIASGQALGAVDVDAFAFVTVDGIASAFAAGVVRIAREVGLAGIGSGEALGQPDVDAFAFVTVDGVASGEAAGTPMVGLGLYVVAIDDSALGTPRIVLYLLPEGIASEEAVGAPSVYAIAYIEVDGITSGEALGPPRITLYVVVDGIESEEAFGDLSTWIRYYGLVTIWTDVVTLIHAYVDEVRLSDQVDVIAEDLTGIDIGASVGVPIS